LFVLCCKSGGEGVFCVVEELFTSVGEDKRPNLFEAEFEAEFEFEVSGEFLRVGLRFLRPTDGPSLSGASSNTALFEK
jgi:hypothetical protein